MHIGYGLWREFLPVAEYFSPLLPLISPFLDSITHYAILIKKRDRHGLHLVCYCGRKSVVTHTEHSSCVLQRSGKKGKSLKERLENIQVVHSLVSMSMRAHSLAIEERKTVTIPTETMSICNTHLLQLYVYVVLPLSYCFVVTHNSVRLLIACPLCVTTKWYDKVETVKGNSNRRRQVKA